MPDKEGVQVPKAPPEEQQADKGKKTPSEKSLEKDTQDEKAGHGPIKKGLEGQGVDTK